jgi:raffinose/stachyose/melibiose transport system substrate-binding protein
MDRISRREFLALGAGAALTAAVSCTPGGNTKQAVAPPKPANTGVTVTKPVTLTVWDQEQGGKISSVWDSLNKGFESKYPNVTIHRVSRGFSDLKTLLKLALTGPDAPDVVEANQGWPDMGQMVKAGLLLPLDNYASAYGWNKNVPATVNAANSWTPDGKQFGTGSLFGYTTSGEIVGVYYNKQKLSDLSLSVPTTLPAFVRTLETIKQAGEIPIQFTDLDQFAGAHTFAAIQERYVPESYMTDFIFGLKYDQLSFDTPQNVQAATVLQDWAKKGYFTPDFLAIGYDDSVSHFAHNQGTYMITGNWIVAQLGADNTNYGFIPMPPSQAGGSVVSTGGPGFPLAISSSSKNPDVAAAYIDWMTNDEALKLLVPTGAIPLSIGFTQPGVTPSTVLGEVLGTAAKVRDANAIVPYEDWATPTFYTTLTSGIQELMGDKITPQQFVSQMQQDYGQFQSSRPAPASSASASPSAG